MANTSMSAGCAAVLATGRRRPKSTTSAMTRTSCSFAVTELAGTSRLRASRPATATRSRASHYQLNDDRDPVVNPLASPPSSTSSTSHRHNKTTVNASDAVSDAALLSAVCAGDDVTVLDILAGTRRDHSVPATPRSVRGLVDSRRRPVLGLLLEHGASPVILRALLQHGADPNDVMPASRNTPLHIAAKHGYQVCVNLLLSFGANVESLDASGNTPLMTSCRGAHSSVVRLLMGYGSRADTINSLGQTALHLVAEGCQDVGLLCARVLLTESDCRPSVVDSNGRTPLLMAAINNQMELAMLLLDHDSSVETIDLQDLSTGQTCLHWAVRHQSIKLVRRLIDLGADINIRDRDWNTPFIVAVSSRYQEILSILVGAGCDMQVTDRQFNTALHLVSRDGLHELIPLLVRPPREQRRQECDVTTSDVIAGDDALDVNLKAHGGVTALMLAAHRGHVTVVGELLKAGADPDVVDRHRATALIYALMTTTFKEPCPAIVKTLIRYNCDVNKPANVKEMCKFCAIPATVIRSASLEEGRLYSPLEVAFLRGQVIAFSILVRAGSDLTQFRWLFDVSSGPTFASCLHTWTLPSWSMTSSGAQAAAVMIRSARRHLQQTDVVDGVQMNSLTFLCIKPALQSLISYSRRLRLDISDVIASLSKAALSDDVRRLLTYSHLDDVTPVVSPLPNVTSPTSPMILRRESYESPASGKKVAGSPPSRPASRAFQFNDVTMKPRSLPQTPTSVNPTLPGNRSPKKQPNILCYKDLNSNVVMTSLERHGNETTRASKQPLRPKTCALERPSQRAVRVSRSATSRFADDISGTVAPPRRRLPATPGT